MAGVIHGPTPQHCVVTCNLGDTNVQAQDWNGKQKGVQGSTNLETHLVTIQAKARSQKSRSSETRATQARRGQITMSTEQAAVSLCSYVWLLVGWVSQPSLKGPGLS